MEGAGAGDPWGLSGKGGLGCAWKKGGVSNKTLIYCEMKQKVGYPNSVKQKSHYLSLHVHIIMPELADLVMRSPCRAMLQERA